MNKKTETYTIDGELIGQILSYKRLSEEEKTSLIESLATLMMFYQLHAIDLNWGLPERYRKEDANADETH